MEIGHCYVLTAACESWDRCEQARQELAAVGSLTYADKNGVLRAHPAVQIERDSRAAFRAALKQLRLDEDEPRAVLGRPTLGNQEDY
jgi:phage terminase small subunit